jgi:hypothetical protein
VFFDEAKKYVPATGFIVQPDGLVAEAVYGTGPVGTWRPTCLVCSITLVEERAQRFGAGPPIGSSVAERGGCGAGRGRRCPYPRQSGTA